METNENEGETNVNPAQNVRILQTKHIGNARTIHATKIGTSAKKYPRIEKIETNVVTDTKNGINFPLQHLVTDFA